METFESIDDKIASLFKEISSLKTRRNELTLPGKLPPELLVLVFQMLQKPPSVDPSQERLVDWKWIRVIRVCKRFRDVALTAPQLWNKIDCDMPNSWAKLCSLRAKKKRFGLCADTPKGLSLESAVHVEALATKYLPRAKTARFNLNRNTEDTTGNLEAAMHTKAPFLEEFRYKSGSIFDLRSIFLGGRSETLRKLSLRFVVISTFLGAFPP
jgi:hypothetical protein